MAYFWSFILALVVVTGVLAGVDLRGGESEQAATVTLIELPEWEGVIEAKPSAVEEMVQDEPVIDDAIDPGEASETVVDEPVPSEALAQATESDAEISTGPVDGSVEIATAPSEPEAAPDTEPKADIVIDPEVLAKLAAAAEAQKRTEPEVDEDPGYTINDDGSILVRSDTGDVTIPGRGTDSSAYVLSWDLLRRVQREYDPKKDLDDLPEWLSALDGKRVVIEGNTLVALVASETKELLVMQNPWDGCCIGVPPTPYDAVEVKLNNPVTFGYSATGYGSIKGTMRIDPYVVSGWLLGLYVIEDASYTSGEGVELPEL